MLILRRDERAMSLGKGFENADRVIVLVVAEKKRRSVVEMEIEIADQIDRSGEECARGNTHLPAAGFGAGGDGVGNRFGVVRLAVGNGAEIGDDE